MKANFALTLSFTGIRLLHRAAGGWRFVGDVSLDDADLDGALAALRKTALELEPTGLRTKLVIPDTQIKYLTIDTEDVPDEALRDKAAVALEGTTPYAVDELVFDLSPDGGKTHVAAVARETLLEAEAFAVQHRFAPISVVAVPDGEAFLGEPFFGATDHASNLLGPGDRVEPDGIAVVELDAQEWPEGPVVDVSDDTPVARTVADPPATEPPTPAPDESDNVTLDAGQESDARETAATLDARPPVEPEETPDEVGGDTDASDEEPSGVGFASRRRPGAGGAPKLGGVTRRFEPAPVQARDDAGDIATAEDETLEEQKTSPSSEPPLDDDVPNPPPSVLAAFLSRRQEQATAASPAAQASAPDTPPAPTPQKRVSPTRAAPAESALDTDDATAPAMDVAARKAPPEIRPVRVPRPKSERQRMTVFGARQPEPDGAAAVGGKPRFLGLILTAMLLLLLAGVAAWAAAFVEDGLARFFGPREPEAAVTAEERAPEPEPESALSEPDVPATPDSVETASLEPELPPETSAEVEPEMLVEPAEPPVFDPAEAEAHYAVTGIWTIPPEVPEAPGVVDLDELYMTSIDPANLSFDAVALTPEETVRNDHAPLAFANPAPAGTEFDLDDRGLVIPTPDGAMSPDGILIHAGQPPAVPPDTPDRAAEAPDDMDAAVLQKLSGYRPKSRPGDLVENTERQRLGGLSRSELAEYRPRLRPEAVKQAAEEDETPTARAVASSLRPSNRPGNFERIVAQAERRTVQQETRDEEPEQTASVAPRTVAPAIPSRSSVAKEATVRNAINLRRINLMGVYGSPSNRRALVRLSNGRYKKVKVGDRIDGGRVSAIGDSELSYVKGNRSIVLTMPRT